MSNPSLQAPKGTRDFYPEEMRRQNHIFDTWRKACLASGFEEYEGPTFEHLNLFTEKSGPEIVTQLYNFTDKGEREIALRPEMTPTLARMVNQKGPSLKLPLRWFSLPRLFRYEKAQKGRLREFFQLNMDIIGCNEVSAEIDLFCAIIGMLEGFGLKRGDFSIHVSSRRLLSDLLDGMGVAAEKKPAVYSALDKRAKVGEEEFKRLLGLEGLTAANIDSVETFFHFKNVGELAAWVKSAGLEKDAPAPGAVGALEELQTLFRTFGDLGLGDYVKLDTSIVRGLAYYTGIVFEVYDEGLNMRAVAGGGRYDNLLANLGGQSLSGVGFGMGDVVLADLIAEKGLMPSGKNQLDYYLLDVNPAESKLAKPELIKLAQGLRAKGRRVVYALSGEKFKKQMAQANDMGAARVVFFGSDKAVDGKLEVKDFKTGEQGLFAIEAL
jgi:histidyl-tRNA synthetase